MHLTTILLREHLPLLSAYEHDTNVPCIVHAHNKIKIVNINHTQ